MTEQEKKSPKRSSLRELSEKEISKPLSGLPFLLCTAILEEGPIHGYQLMIKLREAQPKISEFDTAKFDSSKVYTTLRRLVDAGLITRGPTDSADPRVIAYTLTEIGSERLKQAAEFHAMLAATYEKAIALKYNRSQ